MPVPDEPAFMPLVPVRQDAVPLDAARAEYEYMAQRRSVRMFASTPIDRAVIETLIATAGTAPSGANKQPWRFVAVQDAALKREIRLAAEEEERRFYRDRASARWLEDLKALGTNEDKPFLETAPWLIIVFKILRDDRADALNEQVYYVNESVGIATGLLISAIHHAGLVTLTHTPSPMGFLGQILGRPAHERPYLLLPVGYPSENCRIPDISRKSLAEIMTLDREDQRVS